MTWQFSLTGLLVGVLVGMTGMGGGSLMTPILILLFGFNAKVAVGTDILHGAIFKSFGAVRHRTLGTVHARLGLVLVLSGIKLVGVPQATYVIAVTLVAGAVVLAAWWLRELRLRRIAAQEAA